MPRRRHAREQFPCPVCGEVLGIVRPAAAGGRYLDITHEGVVVWWDSARAAFLVACSCGEPCVWYGPVNWKPLAA